MEGFYLAPNNDSFRLAGKNKSTEEEILATAQVEELAKSFYFAPNNGSFRLAKQNEPIGEEILDAAQIEELAKNVKDFNKRGFLKILGVAGLGLAGTTLFPKKADALILGGTPTSSVVGVKNASNTRINPATQETVATLATEATASTLLKTTDLTFASGDLQVKVMSLPDSSFSDSVQPTVAKKGLVDADRHVQVDVLSSALPTTASTETTLTTINFGGKQFALKMTTVGSVDYVAEANTNTLEATNAWRVKKVDSTTGIRITWADGNENFDNVATDLTILNYS